MDKKPFEDYDLLNENPSGFDYERFEKEEETAKTVNKEKKPEKEQKEKPKTEEAPAEIYEWMQSLVSALLICVLVFAFLFRIIGIIGSSMEPTFSDKDSVVISNLFFTPKQGDVVVLRKLSFQEEPIIKRVVAVAGQTVDIDFEKGIVYVDDKALTEPYIMDLTHNQLDFNGKITVPEGSVFVMGDNRNNSLDSRSSMIGCVDDRYIMGKVLVRLLPVNKFGVIKNTASYNAS